MDCPDCGREVYGKACACGWGKRERTTQHIPKNDPRCVWKTNGKRCYMVGDISPDIGDGRRGYCHWHFVCLRSPKDADNFEEFCRWAQGWERYCSVENHYKPGIVWDAISGLAPIHGDPHWCGLVDCKHKSITETAKNGLEVGRWWRENGVRLGMAPTHTRKAPYKPILDAERALWTPKTILARQKLGLGGGIVARETSGIVEEEVPF